MVLLSPEDGWIVAQANSAVIHDPQIGDYTTASPYVLREQHGMWSVADPEFTREVSQLSGTVIQGDIIWGYGSVGTSPSDSTPGKPFIGRYINGAWQAELLPKSLAGEIGEITAMSAISAT